VKKQKAFGKPGGTIRKHGSNTTEPHKNTQKRHIITKQGGCRGDRRSPMAQHLPFTRADGWSRQRTAPKPTHIRFLQYTAGHPYPPSPNIAVTVSANSSARSGFGAPAGTTMPYTTGTPVRTLPTLLKRWKPSTTSAVA
jgi:hypothetical protein